jgi:hypothetical protein
MKEKKFYNIDTWLTLTVKISRHELGSIDMDPDDIDFVGEPIPPTPEVLTVTLAEVNCPCEV